MTNPIKVAIIIPFYNGDHLIKACISSIVSSNHPVHNIYIVDNSTNKTLIDTFFHEINEVEVIKTKPAIGFGRACNIGINAAILDNNDIGILMNQDAIFKKNTIGLLAKHALHQDTFATVPISYSYDLSSIHPKVFSGYLQPVKGFVRDQNLGKLKEKYELSHLQTNGSCVALHLNAIKDLPWFDPIFQMYGEDVELFFRMIETENLSLFLIPKAHIGHIHSQLSDVKGKSKIIVYDRYGGQVMHLKRSQYLKFFIKTFHTYFLVAKHLKFKSIWLFIVSDFRLIFKLRVILKSRNTRFLSNEIKKFIQDDRIS